MKDKLLYAIILFFSRMPFWILYRISDFLAFLLNNVIGYRKDVIMTNLRNSFPEKSEEELKAIRIQFNKNFSDQIVETLKMFTISEKEIKKRIVYENTDLLEDYANQGRSLMVAIAHYGNWEYNIAFPLHVNNFNLYTAVFAPISNKFLNDKIIGSRQRFGVHLMSMKKTMFEVRKHPNHGCVYGFLFEQSPHKSKVKYDLQFLNQTTPVHLGVENVAKIKNAIVITLDIVRVKRGYYVGKYRLLTDTPNETSKYEITNELFRRLEETIKHDPAQWLWSHRRWKYQPGRDYNIAKNIEKI
jgi:KDO2-lipid IV(A) lauroyltransferase